MSAQDRDTPRTSPYHGNWATSFHGGKTIYEHAQTLERELAAANAAKSGLVEALRAMIDKWVSLGESGDAGWFDANEDDDVKKARAAIERAVG